MNNKDQIGGRAYSNGLRLQNKKLSVKVYYDKNDNLRIESSPVKVHKYMKYLKKIPFIRGIASLFIAVFSFLKEIFKNPLKYWFIFLIVIADITYMLIPDSTNIVYQEIFLLIYLAITVALFFIFSNNVSDVFKFHGAEHKAVNYYEDDFKGNIASYSRIHRRCGSNIVFYYIIISILTSFINLGLNIYLRQLIILGISYEILNITPKKFLFLPSLFQKIVTKEPEQRQLKAAKLALQALLFESNHNEKIK